MEDPYYKDLADKGLGLAREEAKKWHRSEEGRAWHSEHGKKSWENKKQFICTCATCGKEFKAYFKRAKHCSSACTNKYFREHCNEVEKICPICGKVFSLKTIDSKRTSCCSRSCGAKKRWRDRSIQPNNEKG